MSGAIHLCKALSKLSKEEKVFCEEDELTNFGKRPKVFSISDGEVLKQFPLIDETIYHK